MYYPCLVPKPPSALPPPWVSDAIWAHSSRLYDRAPYSSRSSPTDLCSSAHTFRSTASPSAHPANRLCPRTHIGRDPLHASGSGMSPYLTRSSCSWHGRNLMVESWLCCWNSHWSKCLQTTFCLRIHSPGSCLALDSIPHEVKPSHLSDWWSWSGVCIWGAPHSVKEHRLRACL